MRKILTGVAVGLFVLALAPRSEALTLTFDTVFSGYDPSGGTPYLTATFSVVDATHVNLVLDGSIDGGEFYRNLFLNFDPTLDITQLTLSDSTDPDVGGVGFAAKQNKFKADGDGKYDIYLEFDHAPPSDRFVGTEQLSYTFAYAGLGTFNDSSFNFLSFPAGGHGPFLAASHVQGIAPDCSGWIAPSVGAPSGSDVGVPCGATDVVDNVEIVDTPDNVDITPEPATLVLFGSGLAVVAARMRRRKA